MKRKILISAFLIGALAFTFSTTSKATVYNSCKGYKWRSCNGHWVLRCTCAGGRTCYAAWQDLC